MKAFFLVLFLWAGTMAAQAQTTSSVSVPDASKEIVEVEAACGQCKFDLPGSDCTLAVRMNGKAYYVTGTDIDDHGDAHAKEGFCQAIRKAKVQGTLVNNLYQVTYFQLLPQAAPPAKVPK
jgi:hypothetical protein